MIHNKIDLYKYFNVKKPEGANGVLETYIHNKCTFTENERFRPAMLVLPGGGYTHLSDREGEPIAQKYLSFGFNAFVLYYSVSPCAYPTQLIEGAMAMAYIRLNATEHQTDASHVCAVGFSAGGHLTGMLATLYGEDCIKEAIGDNFKYCKPDAIILSYPVIASLKPYSHNGSFEVLAGANDELKQKLSLETRVTKNTSPAFIWHTFEDEAVPLENSLAMVNAYRKAGVPFEYHSFEKGGHGLSLGIPETGYDNPLVKQWTSLSLAWLNERGFKINV